MVKGRLTPRGGRPLPVPLSHSLLWWCLVEVPLYLYKKLGGAGGYSWREDRLPLPQHGAMPPPIEGVVEQRQQGVAHP